MLGKWGKYLEIKEIAFDTIDQQQAVFGMQDSFVKIIEKALPVTVSLRDSRVEIKGDSEREVKLAGDVMISLRQMYDQGEKLKSLWEEFEACATPEARFARCMDNLQPMMLNAVTDGKAWVEHQVELSQILGRNQNTHTGSEILWEYARKNWIDPNVEKGTIKGGK